MLTLDEKGMTKLQILDKPMKLLPDTKTTKKHKNALKVC